MKKYIGSMITEFFCQYLPNEAGLSENTIKSYRDTFVLYIKYLEESGVSTPRNIDLSAFNADLVNKFLNWLENERHSSISTRNQRLAAIKSFCNFVIRKAPENCKDCQDILHLRVKRTSSATVEYISTETIASILDQPDSRTLEGIRDWLFSVSCMKQDLVCKN